MLTCRELAHRHASDYIDGQLGWRARLGVRYHLLICDHCRRFVGQMRKVRTFLRNKQNPSINVSVEDTTQQEQLAEHLSNLYQQQKNDQQKKSPPSL